MITFGRKEQILRGEVPTGLTAEKCQHYRRTWLGVPPGPGTALKSIVAELRQHAGLGCGCANKAQQMDEWGVAGCTERRSEIASWLAELGALAKEHTPAPAWLDPQDVCGSIVDEAIRRAAERDDESRKPVFVTTAELLADTYRLAGLLPPETAGIVGISRSGLLPANLLAQHLHLPQWILRQDKNAAQECDWRDGDVIEAGNGWRLHDRRPTDGPLVVVDDTQMTGRSIRRARPIADAWAKRHGYELLYAVIYQNPLVPPRDRADLHVRPLHRPHFLEWNLFNSSHLPKLAFDIDGVLCDERPRRDPFGPHGRPPLYPVRKGTLPLVVTGRYERHRRQTLAWFQKWGMRVQRLEMWPGTASERDRPGAVARFKADHFAKSGLSWFVESCPFQAEEIAQITGKPVICPAAGKVF